MRLIDADALKETIASNVYLVADVINSRDYGMFWTGGIEKAIDEQPTIEERKKGKWIKKRTSDLLYCSECDLPSVHNWPYCERCGADMRG